MALLFAGKESTLEYQISGSEQAETILFIPGLGADCRQFDRQHRSLQEEFCVVSVSMPGHGRSERDPHSGCNLTQTASLILALMDYLERPVFHLVGNSAGGLVSYEILQQAGGRVRSLTTFGTAAEQHSGFLGDLQLLLDRMMNPKLTAWLARRTASKNTDAAALVAEMLGNTPRAVIADYRRLIHDYDYLPVLTEQAEVPVLLLRGQQDVEINMLLFSTLKTLEGRKNAVVQTVAGGGHFLNLDQPVLFENILRRFIRGQQGHAVLN